MYNLLRNKIKQQFLILIFLISASGISVSASAQLREGYHMPDNDDKWYHIGIVIMGTSNRFQINQHPKFLESDTVLVSNPNNNFGFGIGGMHTFKISNRLDARIVFPQLLFVNKSINYHLSYPESGSE